MSKVRFLLKYWLPIVIWMSVIFTASADRSSFRHSSRILAPLLHLLFPHISEQTVNQIVTIARKGAHLTEYGILALLCWRALRRPVRRDPRLWSWQTAGWTLLIVAAYASSDEFHQRFVPGRDASMHDVVIDTSGAFLALLLLRAVGQRLGWWQKKPGIPNPQ